MGAHVRAKKDLSSHYREEGPIVLLFLCVKPMAPPWLPSLCFSGILFAGSSSEVGSMHPEGLAERIPDQADWRLCPLLVYTSMSKQGWRRIGFGLVRL